MIPKPSSLVALLNISICMSYYYIKLNKYKTKLNFIANQSFLHTPSCDIIAIPIPLVRGHIVEYLLREGSMYMICLPELL